MRREDLILSNMGAEDEKDLDQELGLAKRLGVTIISTLDKSYPKSLKEIFSPPKILYLKGKMLEDNEFAVAIVGSRRASLYGIATAERLGYELASRGVVVVSGFARGIDTAAHKGALKAYGRTIAVLGNGLSTVYPPENKDIAAQIVGAQGALVSEFSMKTPPIAQNFPRRNRIISGFALGVIVVEASQRSGALITADFAMEQGRDVFAVPGKIDSATSAGTNELIKQGAKLVQNADDVLQELNLKIDCSKERAKEELPNPNLTSEESAIYGKLSDEPRYVDEIAKEARFSIDKTVDSLLRLQIRKLVKELPGKTFIKA